LFYGRGAMAPDEKPSAPAHLHGLDGLRAVACLAVFVDHVEQWAEWLAMPNYYGKWLQALGRQGVELFFVLSGYLITYRMLIERRSTGRVSIPAFYLRRALRIWPLYYTVVFIVFVGVPWLVHHQAGPYMKGLSSWFVDGLFAGPDDHRLAWYLALLPHFAYFSAPGVLCGTHLWSIGVEEQFYLVWPWLMRVAGKRPLVMCTLVIVAAFTLNDVVFPWGEDLRPWFSAHFGPKALDQVRMFADHAHMEAMAIGAFVAWFAVHQRPLLERFAADAWTRALAYLAIPFGWYFYRNWHTQIGPALIYAFALAALSHGPKSRVLDWAPMRAIGVRSYAIYLLHPLALFLTAVGLERAHVLGWGHARWVYAVCSLGVTFALAFAAHAWIERPALKLKDRFERFGRGVRAAGTVDRAA
jgi:peptidoglycan/LPS O-acetylase OafA/YrhL